MKGPAAIAERRDAPGVKVVLSTLWVFAMLNYLYADVMTLMDPRALYGAGSAGAVAMTPGFLLGAAVLMETAIAMVVLSRVLKYRVNRWTNMAAGALHTAAVLASLFVAAAPALYYLFFAAMETACTLFIVWYAWRWKERGTSARGMVTEGINE